MTIPDTIRELVRDLIREHSPGQPTFQALAAQDYPEVKIRQGDIVIYVPARGSAADGKIVAIAWEGRMVFGRADHVGHQVQLGDKLYPRHMIRGVVLMAIREGKSQPAPS